MPIGTERKPKLETFPSKMLNRTRMAKYKVIVSWKFSTARPCISVEGEVFFRISQMIKGAITLATGTPINNARGERGNPVSHTLSTFSTEAI